MEPWRTTIQIRSPRPVLDQTRLLPAWSRARPDSSGLGRVRLCATPVAERLFLRRPLGKNEELDGYLANTYSRPRSCRAFCCYRSSIDGFDPRVYSSGNELPIRDRGLATTCRRLSG